MKQKKRGALQVFEQVLITGMAAEGKSLARVNDQVLFIPFGAPGDIVDVQVRTRRSNYMEGDIIRFHQKSADRTEPFCSHFGLCGGCRWQHLPYVLQAGQKEQQVIDALERIGGLTGFTVSPIIVSEKERYYRNKLEFTFTSRRWLSAEELAGGQEWAAMEMNGLGFHLPGRFDRILDIDTCHLQPEPSNLIRLFVKKRALELGIPFYQVRTQEGVLRNLIVRNNSRYDFMVILSVAALSEEVELLLNDLGHEFPEITSLHYVVNDKHNDDISDRDIICFSGAPGIEDEIGGLRFAMGPKSFYQTNPGQVVHLYNKALEYAGLTGNETVYDLYTGTGTIANFAARSAARVVGIEYVEQSVIDARENAAMNGIVNTVFVAGDMARVLTPGFVAMHGTPDVVITDPPRAGMHKDVTEQLLRMSPKRMVYISCNPATQARDIALLRDDYTIRAVQPVDMFPQTHHVENIVLLQRNDTI
jgi:23S rRNA (uracil1939-C5)-methyltransferase